MWTIDKAALKAEVDLCTDEKILEGIQKRCIASRWATLVHYIDDRLTELRASTIAGFADGDVKVGDTILVQGTEDEGHYTVTGVTSGQLHVQRADSRD